ncbi:UNVERIFIED_ORG: Lrp/AsnC family leucine-responsive transcriptional regulator [Pseudomonas parafulva]|nr:Lrp/AsnC family leucine-responsive transcriptional regulator [Pseudomonas parafulva]
MATASCWFDLSLCHCVARIFPNSLVSTAYFTTKQPFCRLRGHVMPAELDRIDRALLTALQGNARLTIAELADLVSLTTSPCWRRVKQLEESGYITGYQAVLSPRAMGFGVTAFVSIMMESHTKQTALAFEQQLMAIPQIVACHNISGRYDFLLEVLAADLESFGEFTREVLQRLPGVKEIYSSFSYKAVKEGRSIPVS